MKDLKSGFQIFLLALPLSLGIAKASGYPPAMGVLTAMVGGLITSLFRVTDLSIKGPAAGLITIAAAAMADFGSDERAWGTVSAIVLMVGLIQVLLGIAKLGGVSEFFPETVVHGMLSAIGLIIIIKHIPVLLGIDPFHYHSFDLFTLLKKLPTLIQDYQPHISSIGLLSLLILIAYPYVKISFVRALPASVWVLLGAIPLSITWDLKSNDLSYDLVHIGNFWDSITIRPRFDELNNALFWKYFIMFLFVSTIESLLTVKALETIDPLKRKVHVNGDLIGQGAGNMVSGLLGGLPMISEVVRSSANVAYGAMSKWSNFFHGFFLLLVMLFFIPLIEWIPNASLAALLLFAGYNLASPKHFIHVYSIGKEQFVIFITTIFFTLYEDLLVGVAMGMVVKISIELFYGLKFKNLFKMEYELHEDGKVIEITLLSTAIFTHRYALKTLLKNLDPQKEIRIDLSQTRFIDHSFMVMLDGLQKKTYEGRLLIKGIENHRSLSEHRLSAKVHV